MPITATGAKIGQTFWQVTVYFDDGDVPESVASAEYPVRALGLAKRWAARNLLIEAAKGRPASPATEEGTEPRCYAEIKRGTYRDESFSDPVRGQITDGTWERDDSPGSYLSGSVQNGSVEWHRQ